MKKVVHSLIPLALILLVLIVFAGCGGSGSGSGGSGSSSGSPSSSSGKTTWEKIQEAGVITVGNSPDYEPFEFEDPNGDVVGFDIDLLDLLCEELGLEYELVNISFENIETAVQTGQVDVGLSCFSITEDRTATFDFSIPYFSGGQAIAVNPDSGYTKIEDLHGKKITVGMGTSGMEAVEENIPDADIIGMDNYALAFMQLSVGGCDAAVADLPVVKVYAEKDGFLVLDEILSYEDNAILIKKGNADLTAALNKAIQTLTDNGKLGALVDAWFLDN
ncbi:MAG: transporter substrate-binding domain-containing protein [Clostridiales bacterium]|nr:transporter substrate-binding domain-containing protein [Clostridiales bacterium]